MKYLILDVFDEVPMFKALVLEQKESQEYFDKWCANHDYYLSNYPKQPLLSDKPVKVWIENGSRCFIEIVPFINTAQAGYHF